MTATPRTRTAPVQGPRRRTPAGRTGLIVATSVLLTLFGLLKVGATVFFTLFASAAPQGVGDRIVAAWSLVMGAGYLLIAARLSRGGRALPLALTLTAADVAFGVVKLTVYGETAAVGFTAVSLVLLALVALAARTPRC
jgi:hypothetical protein